MTAIGFSLLALLSTSFGGFIALRRRAQLTLIMAFTGGVLVGLVVLDLLPEIFRRVEEAHIQVIEPMLALIFAFMGMHFLEYGMLINTREDDSTQEYTHRTVGVLSALALVGHSFMDGVGIGLGFQVSATVGVIVALAVIAHDISDGLNTVTLMLVHRNSRSRAALLLMLDAAAPVTGVIVASLVHLPQTFFPLYLGFFAGFLLYIGASEILPRAYRSHPGPAAFALTLAGVVLSFAVGQFV
ncbi:MAG: ZIP family metal transporter [Chloroflexi bacterium]|nr:ZIP family metal transporter [Chloroflexota bacterium]